MACSKETLTLIQFAQGLFLSHLILRVWPEKRRVRVRVGLRLDRFCVQYKPGDGGRIGQRLTENASEDALGSGDLMRRSVHLGQSWKERLQGARTRSGHPETTLNVP